ncbi:ribosomal L7Ae/L30e/S12e/Gadd45 family protein [Candidatus Woesearchaeota archaeon]|nr:ribosomal L7Ae/L30e/S12e/Gadd45 family protein [Candidatus Woesearchaeota archaeon]
MPKKDVDPNVTKIRKLLEEGKAVIGTEKTLAGLKHGRLAAVYLAANCEKAAEADIRHYAGLAGAEVIRLGHLNTEVGTLCKKPFSIQALGERK